MASEWCAVVNKAFVRALVVLFGVGLLPVAVRAQVQYEGWGHRNRQSGQSGGTKAAASQAPTLKPDPRQRLDAGALLCRTEDDLQQHEVAINARLDGKDAPEPVGCRPVRTMTAVTVLDRHGLARTQVKVPGPPEQTGWTDAVVRDAP
jgi:hypothetical protein